MFLHIFLIPYSLIFRICSAAPMKIAATKCETPITNPIKLCDFTDF